MTADPQVLLILALIGLVVGIGGLAVGVIALVRASRLHQSYALLQAGEGRETIVDVMGRTID